MLDWFCFEQPARFQRVCRVPRADADALPESRFLTLRRPASAPVSCKGMTWHDVDMTWQERSLGGPVRRDAVLYAVRAPLWSMMAARLAAAQQWRQREAAT